jgi:hypothetical protein
MNPEADMAIHIASMIPDRALEESALINAITKTAMDLAVYRDLAIQNRAPVLDIVFLLPSRLEKPEFSGLRLHSFDAATQTLRLESAVPDKMVNSTHAERFVIALLLDAIDAAADFFTEQRVLFDAAAHIAMIEAISPKQQYAIN